jgi:tartrate-resistant acid phosphatase type 5
MSCAICEPLESRRLLAVTNGLNAVYFSNRDFTGATGSRTDRTIAMEWSSAQMITPRVQALTFAARWHGLVKPPTTETYTFATRNNDAVRLWVNGKLLIDHWETSPRMTHTGSIALTANKLYDIRLEYMSRKHTSAMTLFWNAPSRGGERIPSRRFFAYDTRSASIGDYGFDNDNEAAVARLMRTWKPQFITTVGDNNYPDGGADTIDDNVGKYFFDFIGNYRGDYGAGSPQNLFFPTLGNHDWHAPGAAPYKSYFTLPGNERYYDFVRGSIHFFAIDSDVNEPDGVNAGSKQAQWLREKLGDSESPFNIVYFHHPSYGSGSEGSTTHMRWPFREWGADLVLAGHNHSYERLSIAGLPYVVNGAGADPEPFDDVVPGSIVRHTGSAGALLIEANAYAMTLQYQTRSGRIVDTLTVGPR